MNTSFNPESEGADSTIAIQDDENTLGGSSSLELVRLQANGSLDPSFTLGDELQMVSSMATNDEGKLIVGGRFKSEMGRNIVIFDL